MKKSVIIVGVLAFCSQAVPSFAGDAAAVYKTNCIACHGKDRKGSPAMAKLFKVPPEALDLSRRIAHHPDAEHIKTISAGRNKMPAFKNKLKAAEIADLVAYLRMLAPTPKPTLSKGGKK